MEKGHRAQGAPQTVFNRLNCSDKETCPSTSRECQGSSGAGKSKAWSGLVTHRPVVYRQMQLLRKPEFVREITHFSS